MSPAVRSGLLIMAGTALMVYPLVAGMAPSVVVTAIAVGIVTAALGVSGTAEEGRGTLPLSAAAVYDRGLAVGLIAAGVIFGILGNVAGLALFGGAGLGTLLVSLTTSYSIRPA